MFGYAIFSDLSSGSHELTQEKVYSIVAVSLAIVLGAVAVISLSLLRHGYTLKDIRRIHRILKDEDLKRHQNSMAKLKWGLVDDIFAYRKVSSAVKKFFLSERLSAQRC